MAEYVVPLPFYDDYTAKASKNPKVAAQSEMHALPNGQFLVLARDGGFGRGQAESLSVYRHIDVFDVAGATNIRGDTYDCADCAVADDEGTLDADYITPATYCSFLDFNVNAQLGRFGMHNGGDQDNTLLVSVFFSSFLSLSMFSSPMLPLLFYHQNKKRSLRRRGLPSPGLDLVRDLRPRRTRRCKPLCQHKNLDKK